MKANILVYLESFYALFSFLKCFLNGNLLVFHFRNGRQPAGPPQNRKKGGKEEKSNHRPQSGEEEETRF